MKYSCFLLIHRNELIFTSKTYYLALLYFVIGVYVPFASLFSEQFFRSYAKLKVFIELSEKLAKIIYCLESPQSYYFDLLFRMTQISWHVNLVLIAGFHVQLQFKSKTKGNKMGNIEFTIPENLRSQWVQINKSGEHIIHNSITQQNFILHRFSKKPCISTKQFIERSIYPIPHSPKLIILDDSPSQLCCLVQSGSSSFRHLIRKKQLMVEVLGVIKDLAVVVDQLRQKYGSFELKEEMIGVLKNQELMVWIHENKSMNVRQFPLANEEKSEERMIRMIVRIVQDNTKLDLTLLMKQYAGALNFKQFIKHLAIKIQVEKFKIAQKEEMTPERHMQQQPVSKGGDHEAISKDMSRANDKIKNFEDTQRNSYLRHRRNYTNFEPSAKKDRSQSKKRQQPSQPSLSTKRIYPNSSIFKKIRKPIEKINSSINISISHSHSSPRFEQFKGSIETTQYLQISFSKKRRPNLDNQPTRVNINSKGQSKNLATKSSEETFEEDHQTKMKQRDELKKCVKDELTDRKEMEEKDFSGLFDEKNQPLYNFQEEVSILINDV